MSIEDQIDHAIRNRAAAPSPGMCVYPNTRRPVDAPATAEVDRLAEEAARLVRDHLGPLIARELARRAPDTSAPINWSLAPDEIELLASIRRDRVWWRRLLRWVRRSGS